MAEKRLRCRLKFFFGSAHARARVGERWYGPSASDCFFCAHVCLVAGRFICAVQRRPILRTPGSMGGEVRPRVHQRAASMKDL
jgi:hypothetical protein